VSERQIRKPILAMELIPAIRARLARLEGHDGLAGGQRAALWRAQQHAAHVDHTFEDLRRYCLDALRPRLLDAADENDYLRGFRQGFQAVLSEIRAVETRGAQGRRSGYRGNPSSGIGSQDAA
jgi:hypothetical protein